MTAPSCTRALTCPGPVSSLQGIIFTAGAMWNILQALNIPIHIQEVSTPP